MKKLTERQLAILKKMDPDEYRILPQPEAVTAGKMAYPFYPGGPCFVESGPSASGRRVYRLTSAGVARLKFEEES